MKKSPSNIGSFLAKNAAPKKKAGTKEHPEITLKADGDTVVCHSCQAANPSDYATCTKCGELLHLVDRLFVAYKEAHDAKASFDSLEAQLLEKITPEYANFATSGDYQKTFNVAGMETPGVQVSWKDAFKKIPQEKEEVFQKRLGDKFDTYFFQARELSLTDTSDEAIKLLLEKLGDKLFKEMFNIEVYLATKPDMDRKQFELPSDIRLGVIQHKPATKIRKED